MRSSTTSYMLTLFTALGACACLCGGDDGPDGPDTDALRMQLDADIQRGDYEGARHRATLLAAEDEPVDAATQGRIDALRQAHERRKAEHRAREQAEWAEVLDKELAKGEEGDFEQAKGLVDALATRGVALDERQQSALAVLERVHRERVAQEQAEALDEAIEQGEALARDKERCADAHQVGRAWNAIAGAAPESPHRRRPSAPRAQLCATSSCPVPKPSTG